MIGGLRYPGIHAEVSGGDTTAVSEENLAVVRESFERFGIGTDLAGASQLWDEQVDWRAIEGAPDDVGVFIGRDALVDYYQQWVDTFDDIRAVPEELINAGDDTVFAWVHVTGRMKESDSEIDMRLGIVYGIRDGLIVRGREYATRDEALEAAGLSD